MSVRIHKAIGYGLTDLMASPKKLTDLLRDHTSLDKLHEQHEDEGFQNWKTWIKNKKQPHSDIDIRRWQIDQELTLGLIDAAAEMKQNLAELVVYNPLEATIHGILFMPPAGVGYQRMGDAIDLVEWKNNNRGVHDSVVMLKKHLPGFQGYMDNRTGQYVTEEFYEHHRSGLTLPSKETYRANGFNSYTDFQKHAVLNVPTCVRLMVEYLDIFKDPQTILALRPMIYTYWC